MAISEEEIRLILNTQDSKSKTHELATEVQQLNEYLKELAVRFNEGAIAQQQYQQYSEGTNKELREKSALLEDVARKADVLSGTEGGGGMAGLSTNIFKAERAFTALATGTGLARAGPMLESVLLAVGGPAGLGMAIGALAYGLEGIAPKLAKFFDLWDTEKLKQAADQIKKFADEAKGLTTPEKGDVEKDVAAGFKKFAAAGFDVTGMAAGAIGAGPSAAIPTGAEQAAVERFAMAGGALGGGPALELIGGAMSPESLRKVLETRNMQRAERLTAEATHPGAAGKRARNELKRLARDNPGAFPPEFRDFLESVEEDAATRGLAEQAIEEEEGAKFPSGAPGRERRNQALEEEQEAQKRADRIATTYVEDAKTNEQELHRIQHEKEKAARDAAQATAKAARERKAADAAAARAGDPSRQLGEQASALEDRVTAIGAGLANAGMLGQQTPQSLRALAGQVVRELPNSGGDVAAVFQQLAQQAYFKAQQDMARAMQRGQVWSETRE